ncbi:MAG: Internalization-related competence protein ComEC/Rec2 protein [Candidatus Berkelbacteria bacterium]|nr:Internalization-related competence protein ComEC/Rec2 protein [Candidatus Berkelbacteria bacterium]
MSRTKSVGQFIFSILFILGIIFLITTFNKPQAAGDLKVYFLDVGQGDSTYIKLPSGKDILIDGGPDNSVLNQLGKVMDFADREINLVILSHPHADHLNGLLEVLDRYKIDQVWETGVEYPSSTYDSFKEKIKNQNIPDKFVKAGDTIYFGDIKISILYPLSGLEKKTIDNLNNASIVNRLDNNKFSILFSGDLEKDIQKQLLDKNIFTDVLKVAHHGSENGLSEDFLNVVRPEIAVISVGYDNKYGHPASSVISLLKKYAVKIYRTDQNGTVEIDSNGKGYWVK